MTRLHSEWLRLYLPHAPTRAGAGVPDDASLIDAGGKVRAMVLAVQAPAGWTALSAVWRGVQTDLALPAPGIAVSGTDGFQLWFSLAEAVPAGQAHAFVQALRARYLSQLAPARTALLPALDAGASAAPWQAGMLPPRQVAADRWSAFVAHDLAPMFTDTPWLDMPPSPEGQADLLARLHAIAPGDWRAAMDTLAPVDGVRAQAATANAAVSSTVSSATSSATPSPASRPATAPTASRDDPKCFLIEVMNDETAPLALRIEAAKALLAHGGA